MGRLRITRATRCHMQQDVDPVTSRYLVRRLLNARSSLMVRGLAIRGHTCCCTSTRSRACTAGTRCSARVRASCPWRSMPKAAGSASVDRPPGVVARLRRRGGGRRGAQPRPWHECRHAGGAPGAQDTQREPLVLGSSGACARMVLGASCGGGGQLGSWQPNAQPPLVRVLHPHPATPVPRRRAGRAGGYFHCAPLCFSGAS